MLLSEFLRDVNCGVVVLDVGVAVSGGVDDEAMFGCCDWKLMHRSPEATGR